ncbi:hypothetical protein ARMGADRAFT_1029621 [Armillaria gallica]|uniref:Uncharacterized protein n=1 Tax=Armillaria gallica TaxID=47427 RepID=A0A2H3DKE3_ARMGA|nr:hypothetical protein ARMGADRAFT_1029621 [Armillaria gallica]
MYTTSTVRRVMVAPTKVEEKVISRELVRSGVIGMLAQKEQDNRKQLKRISTKSVRIVIVAEMVTATLVGMVHSPIRWLCLLESFYFFEEKVELEGKEMEKEEDGSIESRASFRIGQDRGCGGQTDAYNGGIERSSLVILVHIGFFPSACDEEEGRKALS